MLSAETIQQMKRKNVSINIELTKQRAMEILKSATRAQKDEIDAIAGLKRVSQNRVYVTGSISAKMAVAIAQTLNVDPAYLTGESDERGECTDRTLNSFLSSKGYGDLIKETVKPRRNSRVKKVVSKSTAPVDEPPSSANPQEGNLVTVKPDERQAVDNSHKASDMTEEEAVQLLRALYLRVKFNGELHKTLEQIQALLA